MTYLPSQGADQGHERLDSEFQAALAEYNSGHFGEASGQLEKLVRRLPESFEVHELLGMVYSAESEDVKAGEHLEKAVRLNPTSAAAHANLATNLVRLKKFAPAEVEFKKAVELEPQSYDAVHNLGEFYIASGKLPQALPYLEKAQRIRPAAYDNGYDLSLAYVESARYDQARQSIESLLGKKDTAELHNLLAEVDEKDGKFVDAENQYEIAAHMDPSEGNLFDWGSELLLHRTLDPSIEVFRRAVERYPSSPRLAIGLGMALYSRGNYDEAVKALLKATELSPSDPRCYYFLSKAYNSSPSQAKEVIQSFHRFRELKPQDARAAYYYALSLWKGGRTQDAGVDIGQIESLLKDSIQHDANFADAYLQLGNLYSEQNKYADAIPEYERALELNPELADGHYRLGQAYVHSGQKQLAQQQLAIYQRLRAAHLADLERQRAEIQQFVYSEKEGPNSKP
ncbi:MAG: tetratricopeptide repeat protein [Acidobacteria bacterium]|nr:tetratricopeptide repeat protein [Acidobacteriota bacterium]